MPPSSASPHLQEPASKLTRRSPPKRKRQASSTTTEVDRVTQYASDVHSGRIVAGPHVRGACLRHLTDLKRTDIHFDLAAVDRVLDFFESVLCLAGGDFEGKPFLLEPWQAFCVGSLFGWKRPNGQRRFRWFYGETGKGSGKSPLAAGVGHYMLCADKEARAEVYAAATKKDQAMVLFRDAVAMYEQSKELKERLIPSGGNPIWQLTYMRKASFFKAISDDDGKSGPRPSCALVDEVHEHKKADTIEMLEAGFKFRQNPMMFMITNSGSDPTTVCWKYHDLVAKICAGEAVDDEIFGYVCSLDEGDDPFEDESCWIKANPSLGTTIREDYLLSRITKARHIPSKRSEVLRLNFCVWTDLEGSWLDKPTWMAVQKPFDRAELRERKCWIGLDLARRNDLTAMTVVVEDGVDAGGDAKFLSWTEFWLPEKNLRKKEAEDSVEYRTWASQGHLVTTPGTFTRLEWVAARLIEVCGDLDVQTIAYDKYAVLELGDKIDDLGAVLPLLEHPQGFRRAKDLEELDKDGKQKPNPLWMPSSIEKAEELITEVRIGVLPNPILTWNVANVAFERDAQGNRKMSKRKATGRIDGAVSFAMACGAAMAGAKTAPKSFWEAAAEAAA